MKVGPFGMRSKPGLMLTAWWIHDLPVGGRPVVLARHKWGSGVR
jgi:hypothetical protein